jgi:ATP-dependent protease ClpP protease subunit
MKNEQKRSNHGYEESQEFSVNFIPDKSGTYIIEIDGPIESPKQFSTAVQILGMAKEEDTVEIRITDCPGGSIGATDGFLHAIRKCQAHIHMIGAGGVHSMGSMILLEADSFELANGFSSLIHCGSGGSYGSMNEVRVQNKFDEEFYVRRFKETYEAFLSPKELEDMLEGKDIWLDAQGWVERAEKRAHHFKAKYEKMLKAQKKPRAKKPTEE